MQIVHLDVTPKLHLWSRRIVLLINITEAKFGFTKGLELGPILPTDTAWYEN
jgi:hypothetical protein